jgi:hypothetical protein
MTPERIMDGRTHYRLSTRRPQGAQSAQEPVSNIYTAIKGARSAPGPVGHHSWVSAARG